MGPPRLLPLLRRLRRAAGEGAGAATAPPPLRPPALSSLPYSTYNSGPWIPTSFAAAATTSVTGAGNNNLAAANPYARRRNPFLRDAEQRARRRASAWALLVGSVFAFTTGAILATAPADDEDDDDDDGGGNGVPATREEAAAAAAAQADKAVAAEASSSSTDGVVASGRKLLPLHMRRRIFFKYEKRIREMSSLEKTFDYFASVVAPEPALAPSDDGNNTQQQQLARHMTARDLVRAVVPTYPPIHSDVERAGRLPGEPGARPRSERDLRNHAGLEDSVFKRFDVNGDGLISYAEFVLVVNLLAIPEDEVRAVFDVVDVDGSGAIDAPEFAAVMRMLERRAGVKASFLPRPGKHSATNHKNVAAEDAAILRFFFGADGKGSLDLAKWRDFISELHSDVRRLEFAHYDVNGDGECSAEDFATSLVTAADVKLVDHLLDRAESLPRHLRGVRVKQSDFDAVAKARAARRQVGVALGFCRSMGRSVTAEELRRLLTRTSGAEFRPEIVAIIMHVFSSGSDDGGAASGSSAAAAAAAAAAADPPSTTLDVGLFLDVMRRRSRVPGQQYEGHGHHHNQGGGGGKGGGKGGARGGGGGGGQAVSDMDGDDDDGGGEDGAEGPLGTAWRRIVRTVTRGGGGGDDD
jgi:hypothetical protein